MPEDGDEQPVRVGRVDDERRDLLRVAQLRQMRPGAARVGGLVDAVADREVGTLLSLAGADVEHAGIGRRDRERADRAGAGAVEDRLPRPPGVGRLPHAAVRHPHVEGVGLLHHAGDGAGAAGAMRPDVAPGQFAEERRVDGARRRARRLGARRGHEQSRQDQRDGDVRSEHAATPRPPSALEPRRRKQHEHQRRRWCPWTCLDRAEGRPSASRARPCRCGSGRSA